MNFVDITQQLNNLTINNKNLYLLCNPLILDFTNPDFTGKLFIFTEQGKIEIIFDKDKIINIISLLKECVFKEGNIILTWQFKNLLSFYRYHSRTSLEIDASVIDLQLLERFSGIREDYPESFIEADRRFKTLMKLENWSKAKNIYTKTYYPLMTETIPDLENLVIADSEQRKFLHAYYEIEGTLNGRLKSGLEYKRSYNPHSLSAKDKTKLKTLNQEEIFINFDYICMEVSILAWLTKDKRLLEILNSSEDFYRVYYKLLFNKECENRDLVKRLFLPIVYGLTESGMEVSEKTAKSIIVRTKKLFPEAFAWIEQEKNNWCLDYFGRRRHFDNLYKARNFLVASPASIISLKKLIELNRAIKGFARLFCHVHDSFVVLAERKKVESAKILCKSILEKTEDKDLILKVECNENFFS